MLSFCSTRTDKIRTERVRCFGDKAGEARLRWFGHRRRRDSQQKDDKEVAEVETGRQEEDLGGDLWMQ